MGNCQRSSDSQILTMNRMRNGPIQQLQITTVTWNKDYQGLFDYQSKQITKSVINVKQSGIILKINKQFKVLCQPEKIILKQNSDKILYKFIKRPDSFCVQPVAIQSGNYVYQKSVWMIVKSAPDKMYSLRQGDIIKLGRQRVRVKQKILKDKNDSQNQHKQQINAKLTLYQTLTKTKPQKSQKLEEQQEAQNQQQKTQMKQQNKPNSKEIYQQSNYLCRICLDPGTNSNPLITPCKCAGSMKYIHLICLQMWLGKRLNPVIKQHSVTINWKPLLCELCTSHFLYKIYIDNKRFYTVQIPRPAKPYLVLQVIHKDKTKKKVYHLISFAQKKKLSLGRKQDTDVRISQDISVSRNHASVRYEQDTKQFIIEDSQSKFGTLILVKRRLVVRQNTPHLAIQVGPNIFQFQVKRGFGQANKSPIVDEQEEQLNSQYQEDDEQGLEQQQAEQQQKQQQQNLGQVQGGQFNANSQPHIQFNGQSQVRQQINELNIRNSQIIPESMIIQDRKIQESKPTALIKKKQVQKIVREEQRKQNMAIKQESKQTSNKKQK